MRKKLLYYKGRGVLASVFYPVFFFFFSNLFLFVFVFVACENVANITRVYYSVLKNVFFGNLGILWVCDT